ncbi:hypothetical protein BVC80_8927g19 [Macleaya cordata]|uniref:Uncharacterized protein n=1 Tax=Macleaya cordata TaxID=56857 RepID=A0A200R083_MACCD|nr:hypothetical protein BVC80_8927g19 [Macleaya cordata]
MGLKTWVLRGGKKLVEEGAKINSLLGSTSCYSFFHLSGFQGGDSHLEISLSSSDLETIARFGCPSVEKNTAFAAKRLRSFFSIQEKIVCQACKLKSSCTVVNHTVGKRKISYLSLVDIMRVLTLYGLELVSAQLVIPKEIKDSANKLLGEVVNPSQISHENPNPGV